MAGETLPEKYMQKGKAEEYWWGWPWAMAGALHLPVWTIHAEGDKGRDLSPRDASSHTHTCLP
jgi:hypothetical protein